MTSSNEGENSRDRMQGNAKYKNQIALHNPVKTIRMQYHDFYHVHYYE